MAERKKKAKKAKNIKKPPITAQQAAGYKAAITKLQKKVEILEEKLKRAS